MKTLSFTSAELSTLYFAVIDKIDALETLLDDKPSMESSIQEEARILHILKQKLAYAS